jgi:Flp pilus assembly protein TadG
MHNLIDLLKRFRSDERGVFAVIFGVMAVVLVAFAGAAVDYTSMETARTKAQIALDSAALGLAPTIYDDPTRDELMASALAIVNERINDPGIAIAITDVNVDRPNGTLRFTGTVTAPMAFVQLVGIPTLTATLNSEATKGSINIEVAVSLDVSGSMASYIGDLQDGLDGLIDLVVSDIQEPTYSKMAIVPWSTVVYAGGYAPALRGSVPPALPISTADWAETRIGINSATKARPVVLTTASNHGYSVGDTIFINGVSGMTQLNNKYYRVGARTNNTISLQTEDGDNVDGRNYSNYSSSNSDYVRRCIFSTCDLRVNASNHGFQTGDWVRAVTSVGGYNNAFEITRLSSSQLTLVGSKLASPPTGTTAVTGGDLYCTEYGCEWYRFQRQNRSDFYTWRITDCVTERAVNTYSDVPPSTTLLGRNYHSDASGNCDTNLRHGFTPLTADKNVLFAESAALRHYLYTAGHLGTAWAWYLLAPDWGYLWPEAENVPSEYNAENTLKVAILMTDGEYNREFCNGVWASTIHNCNAPASSTNQARELCTRMKAEGITIYTVGFNISANSSPAITMRNCASDLSKYFLPATGEELVQSFAEIGQNITDLRLSL